MNAPSLTSQTQHFHKQGNGPVNCIIIQATGMQLDR